MSCLSWSVDISYEICVGQQDGNDEQTFGERLSLKTSSILLTLIDLESLISYLKYTRLFINTIYLVCVGQLLLLNIDTFVDIYISESECECIYCFATSDFCVLPYVKIFFFIKVSYQCCCQGHHFILYQCKHCSKMSCNI